MAQKPVLRGEVGARASRACGATAASRRGAQAKWSPSCRAAFFARCRSAVLRHGGSLSSEAPAPALWLSTCAYLNLWGEVATPEGELWPLRLSTCAYLNLWGEVETLEGEQRPLRCSSVRQGRLGLLSPAFLGNSMKAAKAQKAKWPFRAKIEEPFR